MSGHTPGPWAVMPAEVGIGYLRVRGTMLGCRYKVANVHDVTYDGVHEREAAETRANARLIAAAPELLEALRIVAAYPIEDFAQEAKPADYPLFGANDWQLQVGHVKAARAAIRKATE